MVLCNVLSLLWVVAGVLEVNYLEVEKKPVSLVGFSKIFVAFKCTKFYEQFVLKWEFITS